MNLFEIFHMLTTNFWLYGGAFLLVLSILVFVHEWGHYIIARACGVRVEVFSIGFGKEIFGFTDKHDTRWKFSLIPLGGYVKLFGDVDPASAEHTDKVEDPKTHKEREMTESEKKVAFFNKPVSKRAAIVFAGPAINYLFAIIILSILYSVQGQPVTPPSAAAIIAGSSAEKAGFKPHDYITAIDGETISSFEDIRRDMMIALDSEKHFTVVRNGRQIELVATPQVDEITDKFGFKSSRGLLGIISPVYAVRLESIKEINGKEIKDVSAVRSELLSNLDHDMSVTIDRGKEEPQTLTIHPASDYNKDLSDQEVKNPILYLAQPDQDVFIKFTPIEAVGHALSQSYTVTTSSLEALGQMVTGARSTKELGGIIRIGAMAGDMASQGFIALVVFTALLSINLGFINLMPIPLLDGGHLLFYGFEAVLGRPVPEKIQEYAFQAGLVFLVSVMAFANLNDLMQLIL